MSEGNRSPFPNLDPSLSGAAPAGGLGRRGVLGSFPFLRLQFMAENNLGVGCHSPSPQRMMLSRSRWQPVGVRPWLEKGPASWRLSAPPRTPPCSRSRALACTLTGALPGTGLLLLSADKAGSQPQQARIRSQGCRGLVTHTPGPIIAHLG